MAEQPTFEIALLGIFAKCQKIKIVRVFEKLLREIGLRLGQRLRKVCQRLSLTLEQLAFNLMRENGAAPAMFYCLLRVPEALGVIFQFLQKNNAVAPGICDTGCVTNSASSG